MIKKQHDEDYGKWNHAWWLFKHIIWFLVNYKSGEHYLLFCSTLKKHDAIKAKLSKLLEKEE
jgi:hypothetical protein